MKVSRWLQLAAGLLVGLMMISCGGTNSGPAFEPTFEVKTNPVEVDGKVQYMSITADEPWEIRIHQSAPAWVSVNPTVGKTSADVVLKVERNTDKDSRTAELELVCSGKSVKTIVLEQKGTADPIGGGGSQGSVNDGAAALASTGWLELPAIPESSSYGFFNHKMTMQNSLVRNYSFCWDYKHLVAHWVAYPLCKAHFVKTVSRTDAWGLDPKLDEEEQPVLYKGFSDGNCGWKARGHQLPSADRLMSYEANAQTFYSTNMTPQTNEGLNSSIWADLEGKIRSWASSSDTVYVITGCIPNGSNNYCLDNVGKKVTAPTAYYKAVLRYSKNTTMGYSGYMGCAFWFENRSYSDKSINKSHAISIDEVEKRTGLDMFVNLPALIGKDKADQIEAENPSTVSWWW